MKRVQILLALCLLAVITSRAEASLIQRQQPVDSFAVGSYIVKDTGAFQNYHYVITFSHKSSPGLLLRKVYEDSTYTKPLGQLFCINDTPHGPYEFYLIGGLISKGNMNRGEEEGEKSISNAAGTLIQKGFYKNGVKTGTWEYYTNAGILYQKKVFDKNGNLKKTIATGPAE